MPINLDKLQRDPAFRALSASAQAKLLRNAQAQNAATAGPSVSRPEGWFESVAKPATSGLAGVLSAMGGDPYGGKPGSTERTVAENIVPQNLTQGVTDLTLAAALGPLAKFAGPVEGVAAPLSKRALAGALRLGAGAAGGATGSTLQGKGPATGAIQGGLQTALGQTGASLVNVMGRYGARALNKIDLGRIGKFLKTAIPTVGKLANVGDFDAAFRGGGAIRTAGERLGNLSDAIAKRVGRKPLVEMQMPARMKGGEMGEMTVLASFQDAVDQIRKLDRIAYAPGGDVSQKAAAYDAALQAHDLTEQVGHALNKVSDGLGDRYLAVRRQYAGANLLTRIFSEPDVWPEEGLPDMSNLQNHISQRHYRSQLNRVFGVAKTEQFLKSVGRGEIPIARDVPGGWHGFRRARVHATPSGHMGIIASLPEMLPGRRVGNVPRRFPAVPSYPLSVGAQSLAEALTNMVNPQER